MKFKKILNLVPPALVCGLAIVCGIFLGEYLTTSFFSTNPLQNLTIEQLQDDITNINYEGKTPDQLTATEAYQVAYNLLDNAPYYDYITTGTIKTSIGVDQKTFTHRAKNNEEYYYEFATYSSMIKMAKKTTFNKGGNITFQIGEPLDSTFSSISYKDKYETYTYDEYYNTVGREAVKNATYLVSSKTVISSTPCSIENGTYTYVLTINPTLAGINYRNEIAHVSGINANTIEFISLEITFSLDSSFNLISQTCVDQYEMKYSGIGVTVNGTYTMNF